MSLVDKLVGLFNICALVLPGRTVSLFTRPISLLGTMDIMVVDIVLAIALIEVDDTSEFSSIFALKSDSATHVASNASMHRTKGIEFYESNVTTSSRCGTG